LTRRVQTPFLIGMGHRILFVCLGNICRSPMAEGVLHQRVTAAGLDWQVDSAGTSGWHDGDAPYGPAIRAAAARGYDISAQVSRMVTVEDFARFDLILAMDGSNLVDLEALRPGHAHAALRLLLSYAGTTGRSDVPDPYYTRNFEESLDLIEAGVDGVIAALRQ